jgi:hypothetical protein
VITPNPANRVTSAVLLNLTSLISALLIPVIVWSNPYPDANQVPRDSEFPPLPPMTSKPSRISALAGLPVLRVGVALDPRSETYRLVHTERESSGTEAMIARAKKRPPWGSYVARLSGPGITAYDSIGTGKEYRKIADEITFRFPISAAGRRHASDQLLFEMEAENPISGKMETVLRQNLHLSEIPEATPPGASGGPAGIEIREIKSTSAPSVPTLRMTIYAEGYTRWRKEVFWRDAEASVAALVQNKFPMVNRMKFYAVFAPSNERLGDAQNLGGGRRSRDTYLNLYYPYWLDFTRWYHIVYPASENRFRKAIAVAPYDYALVLADEDSYWGIGNFRVLTAVPAHNRSFIYLLLHEMGHFFGLNEEYNDGGRTELEFAPGIKEPWSQNITFHPAQPKWARFISPSTPLPTDNSDWSDDPPLYGAYAGGYAESEPLHRSHKPGLSCTMDRGHQFCAICKKGIEDVMRFDLGEAP